MQVSNNSTIISKQYKQCILVKKCKEQYDRNRPLIYNIFKKLRGRGLPSIVTTHILANNQRSFPGVGDLCFEQSRGGNW